MQTSRVGVWRCPIEGPRLQAPIPPLHALSHKTSRHYQKFFPVTEFLLYFLNPFQKFLEEEFSGTGHKRKGGGWTSEEQRVEEGLVSQAPHSFPIQQEEGVWGTMSRYWGQCARRKANARRGTFAPGNHFRQTTKEPLMHRMQTKSDFASQGQTLSGTSRASDWLCSLHRKAPQKNQSKLLKLEWFLLTCANLQNRRIKVLKNKQTKKQDFPLQNQNPKQSFQEQR